MRNRTPEMEQETQTLMFQLEKVYRLAWWAGLLVPALIIAALLLIGSSELLPPWGDFLGAALLILGLLLALKGPGYAKSRHLAAFHTFHANITRATGHLQTRAETDPLTSLYNRRYFVDSLEAQIERARLTKGALTLVLLDIDGLKSINDNYGHPVGDGVIVGFAELLLAVSRGGDVVGRLGGDEFGVILVDSDLRGATAFARRLWNRLEQEPLYRAGDVAVQADVSIGVAGYPQGGDTPQDLLQTADGDMYANKASRQLQTHAGPLKVAALSSLSDLDSITDF